MKAIIPTAGRGTRLYPHTHTKPKPLVRVAGEPILGHILSRFVPTDVSEVVIVVGGPMQTQVIEYVENEFATEFELSFVEQAEPEGLGHSIYQTREVVAEEGAIIVLGDMLFERGYDAFLERHEAVGGDVDATIGVKPVDEPSHYGVVEPGDDRTIAGLVEKPDDPPSNLAISGVYVVENTGLLFSELERLIEAGVRGAGGEYQLTDALQGMIDRDGTLATFDVEDWYDCGRPETLLEANRVMLDRLETNGAGNAEDAVVIPPVDVGEDVTLERSVVGPYVSVDDGAEIRDSIVRDSLIGRRSRIGNGNLEGSIVGDNAEIDGERNQLNVGDNSTIEL